MSDIDYYRQHGGQGGLEGASRISREMATCQASPLPLDAIMRWDKDTVDDRSRDAVLNDGYALVTHWLRIGYALVTHFLRWWHE